MPKRSEIGSMAENIRVESHPQQAGAQQYTFLMHLLEAAGEFQTSDELLQAFSALLEEAGVRAMALEVTAGPITRIQSYGDVLALRDADAGGQGRRSYTFPLNDPNAPPGCVTYIVEADSTVSEDILKVVTLHIALRLGQETLLMRAEDAEDKALRRISEVATIYDIGQAIDQIELSQLLSMITYRAALLMEAQACSLMLVSEEMGTLRVAASHGLPDDAMEQEQRVGEGIAGRVALTEQPMLIVGDHRDPRLEGVELKPDIGSSMLVPMKSQEGTTMGVLSIRRRRPAADFTYEDLKLFSVFASQAALALTNVRLYADLKRRAGELLKLSTLTRALISTLDMDELLTRVAEDIRAIVGFERCCLFIRDTVRPIYVPRVWRGYGDSIGRNPVREGEGAVGAAARSRTTLLYDVNDPVLPERERERSYLQMKGFARSLGTDSFIAAPILTSQNRCIGVVVADNRGHREPIQVEQVNLLSAFVNQAGIALENARLVEEKDESYRTLQRLRNYTENVLQSIGAGIVSTDARGYVARWNRAAEQTLKLSPQEFREATLSEVIGLLNLPDNEHALLTSRIERVLETGEHLNMHKLTLHPRQRPPMSLNLMLSRLVDHNQDRAGVVMIFEDVTQEVRLEAEVEKMRRLADIGQLAARMAHEVRNALSPIRGAAQIIRSELEAQNSSTEWPDIIVTEVDGLTRLTSEMLDFARPKQLDLRALPVSEFLHGVLQTQAAYLEENAVRVQWNLPDDLPDLHADPIQLRQVIRNLIMNAVQAMPEGGELILAAEGDPEAGQITLSIKDTGVGIADSDLERIFRPFVTTKTKGTGLGLPIVQKIVDHHGGRVEVESRRGEGTTFRIHLPLKPPQEGAEIRVDASPVISPHLESHYPDN